MIPQRFILDVIETGMGGVERDGYQVECVVCVGCGSVVAVERLDRHPHPTSGEEAMRRARSPLVKLTEPKPPRDERLVSETKCGMTRHGFACVLDYGHNVGKADVPENHMAEDIARWQAAALRKWLHYRDNVWPSPSPQHDIARAMHAHALAKMVPFLLGRPDLALDDISPAAVAASYDKTEQEPKSVVDAFGPHSDILPDAADYNPRKE